MGLASFQIQNSNNADVMLNSRLKLLDIIANLYSKQEYIPVGCILSAVVAGWGVYLSMHWAGGHLPGGACPGGCVVGEGGCSCYLQHRGSFQMEYGAVSSPG